LFSADKIIPSHFPKFGELYEDQLQRQKLHLKRRVQVFLAIAGFDNAGHAIYSYWSSNDYPVQT
jgi:hypothetical protein